MRGRTRAARGITLIELVVALAIFGLVAVLGLQALTGTVRLRDDLGVRADRAEGLDRATALLRADLDAVMPLLFYPPDGGRPQSALARTGSGLALSLGGQPRLDRPGAPGTARVEWAVADGQLQRRAWSALYPLRADQAGPFVPVLDGVSGLTLRSYWPDLGWIDGLRPAQAPAIAPSVPAGDRDLAVGVSVYSDTLPRAIEVTLQTRDYGTLRLIEALP